MIAYFCHPDDNDMLLSNRQRAYQCPGGIFLFLVFWAFWAFGIFALMFRSLPPEIHFVL
jgi:hypothetical protein